MRFYDYIFYRFYNYYTLEKDKDDRSIAVTFLISLFEAFNIVTVIMLLQAEYKREFATKTQFIFLFIILAVVNYLIFLRKKRYKSILQYYNNRLNEDATSNRRKSRWLMLYVIFSFIILAFSVLMDAVKGDFRIIEDYIRNLF